MNTRALPYKKKKPSLSGNQSSLLRHLNTKTVLETLQKNGPLSRADISRVTGISGPTITRAILDLLEDKLVEEGEPLRIQLGRPGKVIRLASTKVMVVGVVLNRKHCQVFSSGLNGEATTDSETFPTPENYPALIEQLARAIKARKSRQGVRILGTGVVVRALINKNDHSVYSSPDLPLLEGHRLSTDLCQAAGFETVVVTPALGLCFAERLHCNTPGLNDFAVINIRNGFDVSAMLGGKVLTGHSGFALNFQTDDFEGETDLLLTRRSAADTRAFLAALAQKITLLIRMLNPEKLFIASTLLETQPGLLQELVGRVRQQLPDSMQASCMIAICSAKPSDAAIAAIIATLTTDRKHSAL